MSIGFFAGLRYSSNDNLYYGTSLSHGYLCGSVGIYTMIYDYKRPKIIKDW